VNVPPKYSPLSVNVTLREPSNAGPVTETVQVLDAAPSNPVYETHEFAIVIGLLV
jgi:hypothetical protein